MYHPAIRRIPGHAKQNSHAPCIADPASHGDQCIHVRCQMKQGTESAVKELPVDDHNDHGQDRLQKRYADGIPLKERSHRPFPHDMSHRKIHEDQQEPHRADQSPFQLRRFLVREGILLHRKALRRACPSGCCGFLCPLSSPDGTIPGILHGLDDHVRRRGSLNSHRVGQKADRAARHPRYL